MGEMSSIVSRRPSSMNHLKEAFWMSIRFGRSRTCFRREKLLRGRGATTPLLNYEASLENGVGMWTLQADGRRPEPASLSKQDKPAQGPGSPGRSEGSVAAGSRIAAATPSGVFPRKVGQFAREDPEVASFQNHLERPTSDEGPANRPLVASSNGALVGLGCRSGRLRRAREDELGEEREAASRLAGLAAGNDLKPVVLDEVGQGGRTCLAPALDLRLFVHRQRLLALERPAVPVRPKDVHGERLSARGHECA